MPPLQQRPQWAGAGSCGAVTVSGWGTSDIIDVRFGSKADINARPVDVRFTPNSGHQLSALDIHFAPLALLAGQIAASDNHAYRKSRRLFRVIKRRFWFGLCLACYPAVVVTNSVRLSQFRSCIGFGFSSGFVASRDGLRSRERMGFKPEHAGSRKRLYSGVPPPLSFIAATMDLTVMRTTEWHRELIAHLPTKGSRLRKA